MIKQKEALAWHSPTGYLSKPRHTRRMTTQVFRRRWKQRIVDDLDGAFGMEMYVDLAVNERHTDDKLEKIIDERGDEVAFLKEGRKEGMKFERGQD